MAGMTSLSTRRVVVVLGSGRSGTSLLMQVLARMGMRLSPELIAGREDNPDGFFEDAAIVRIQANLLRNLDAWPFHPLPPDWLSRPVTAAATSVLQDVARDRLREGASTWGFKDPRTASFLPLWRHIFAAEGVEPAYLLALREPGSIIRSFMRAYATMADTAEQVWMARICDALWHCAGDCHLVHYEDWFSRPGEVVAGLAARTGLALPADDRLAGLIKPGLNRSARVHYFMRNTMARQLHDALRAHRGSEFDRERLLRLVAECRESLVVDSAPRIAQSGTGGST